MKAIGPTTSEELRSQSITVLKKHEKSPISLTKIVESKWWDNMIIKTVQFKIFGGAACCHYDIVLF
jgi:hypothetical protein